MAEKWKRKHNTAQWPRWELGYWQLRATSSIHPTIDRTGSWWKVGRHQEIISHWIEIIRFVFRCSQVPSSFITLSIFQFRHCFSTLAFFRSTHHSAQRDRSIKDISSPCCFVCRRKLSYSIVIFRVLLHFCPLSLSVASAYQLWSVIKISAEWIFIVDSKLEKCEAGEPKCLLRLWFHRRLKYSHNYVGQSSQKELKKKKR